MAKLNGVVMRVETEMYHVLQNDTIGADKRVMLSMIKYMTREMNIITVNGDTLSMLMKDTTMSASAIRNSLSNLTRLELIEPSKLIRAEYIVNPVLCFKGSEDATWRSYTKMKSQRKV